MAESTPTRRSSFGFFSITAARARRRRPPSRTAAAPFPQVPDRNSRPAGPDARAMIADFISPGSRARHRTARDEGLHQLDPRAQRRPLERNDPVDGGPSSGRNDACRASTTQFESPRVRYARRIAPRRPGTVWTISPIAPSRTMRNSSRGAGRRYRGWNDPSDRRRSRSGRHSLGPCRAPARTPRCSRASCSGRRAELDLSNA